MMRIVQTFAVVMLGLTVPFAAPLRATDPSTRPDAQQQAGPKQWDCPEQGFSLQTAEGWVKRDTQQPHVALMLRRDGKQGELAYLLMVNVVPLQNPDKPSSLDAQVEGVKRAALSRHPETKF